jgi:hypothetical protein
VVSRRLLTAVARLRSQVMSCWICGGENSSGTGFLRILLFPLPILIPPNARYSLSSGTGTVVQLVADVPSGLGVTPPHEIKKKKHFVSNNSAVGRYHVSLKRLKRAVTVYEVFETRI